MRPTRRVWNLRLSKMVGHGRLCFIIHISLFGITKIFPTFLLCLAIIMALLPSAVLKKIGFSSYEKKNRFACNLIMASGIGFLLYFGIRCENIPKKYMFPLLSVVSVLAVHWVSMVPSQSVQKWAKSIILLYGFFCVLWINFGVPSVNAVFMSPRNFNPAPNKTLLWYAIPNALLPDRANWPYQEIANTIRDAEQGSTKPEKLCVLPDLYYFDWFGCRYNLLTYNSFCYLFSFKSTKRVRESVFIQIYHQQP